MLYGIVIKHLLAGVTPDHGFTLSSNKNRSNGQPDSTSLKNTTGTATIVGGSIAGLTTALALQQSGWDIQVFEATQGELQQRGAGIITQQALFDVLAQLGVSSKAQIGVPIQTRKTFAKNGNVIKTLDLPQIATSWGRIYQLLREHFPDSRYHQNKVFVKCQLNNDHVTALFADGTRTSSDLLIAADGIRSIVRQQLEPDAKPEYAGYVAWRGLIEEQDLSIQERRELFPYFTFCLPEGEQLITYPIAGKQHQVDVGERRYNVVWYRPAAARSMLQELLTDIDGNNNGESIAPDKVRPAVIAKMRDDANRLLSPQHANLIHKLDQPFIQPVYDLTTSCMVHKRVAIVGDAAFTARPHLGVGITKAAEDALSLAKSLDAHTDQMTALKLFSSHRQAASRACVHRSRELGAYLQARLTSESERRFANLHRTSEAVMRETANPLA